MINYGEVTVPAISNYAPLQHRNIPMEFVFIDTCQPMLLDSLIKLRPSRIKGLVQLWHVCKHFYALFCYTSCYFLCRRWEVYASCIQEVTIPIDRLEELIDLIRTFGNRDDLSNDEVIQSKLFFPPVSLFLNNILLYASTD